MTAVGTASPIAQGQAMISTDTAAANACNSELSGTAKYQTRNAATAISITTGTNTALIWSANF